MSWIHKIEHNPEEHRHLGHALGYAMLNCAGLELLTYTYVATLTGSDIFSTGLGNKRFSQRKARVQELLATAAIDDELRARASELWNAADEIMARRNLLAHNPISRLSVSKNTADGVRQETSIVVLDMGSTTSRENVNYLVADKITNVANGADALGKQLDACRSDIEKQLAATR